MLKIDHLLKSYPNFRISVDFYVNKGEFFSLLGPSGCGKTTTLRLISGLEDSDSGRIFLNGEDITRLSPQKRQFGLVFQDYALFPHLNVEENILYGISKENKTLKKQRLEELLGLFRLEHLQKRSVRHLSGGEQQRVALARALAPSPQLLLLDEPFAALDPSLRQSLREELKELQQKLQLTIIFVTHNQEEALSLSHRIAIMDKGTITQIAEPFELYTKPESKDIASFFGEVNFVKLSVSNNEVKWGEKGFLLEEAVEDGDYLFAIRPEYLLEGKGVEAEVTSSSFLGFGVLYLVKTKYGTLRYLETAPSKIKTEGTKLELTIQAKNLIPIKGAF
ncbi:MAG: ABC transporter ATP-binding protein [Firmicutes bacterium]|nr:ABC transporter ATP-binding protein [Bacillota bacterium]MDD4263062.1 ABC transporter ATP-binding protein [Bacillota bacterium]MDD4693304.1 ABC transporter ATP-binding protein [Bacillota bacterium]